MEEAARDYEFPLNKYFDLEENRLLTPRDGISFDQWIAGATEARFAIHKDGFPVFLPASTLLESDEYTETDPYAVVDNQAKWPAFYRRRLNSTIDLVEESLKEAGAKPRILDVACGEGHITAEIVRKFPEAEVSGTDYSISAICTATKSFHGIDFSVADAHRLPYQDEYFDVVVCNNIWEHVPDPLRLLESVRRVLVPGGCAIISTPSRYRFRNMVRVCLGKPVALLSHMHVTEYTVGQVLEQLRFAGMEAKLVDEPLRGPASGVLRFVAFKVAVPLVRLGLRLIGSHHSPEETVFYLARKPMPEGRSTPPSERQEPIVL